MQISVSSPLVAFTYRLAAELESRCGATVRVSPWSGKEGACLNHRPGLAAAEVLKLIELLKPIQVDVQADAGVTDCDADIRIGWDGKLSDKAAYLAAENPATLAELRELVGEQMGFDVESADVRYCADATLHVDAEVSTPAWQVLCWMLGQRGIPSLQRHTSRRLGAGDLQIRIPEPAKAGLALEQRVGIVVRSDDAAAAEQVKGGIESLGLVNVTTELLGLQDPEAPPRFEIAAGPLVSNLDPSYLARIQLLLADLMGRKGVDSARHPLLVDTKAQWATEGTAVISLPFAAARTGALPPYDGPFPERFSVSIYSDDNAAARSLRDRLLACGFTNFLLQELPDDERLEGFRIKWGAAAAHPAITRALVDAVTEAMKALPAPTELPLHTLDDFKRNDCDVWIYLPAQGVADGGLQADMEAPSRFELTLHSPEPDSWQPLAASLEAWGFRMQPAETEDVAKPLLRYGAAPARLVQRVRDAVEAASGITVTMQRSFPLDDQDVWLYLPPAPSKPAPEPVDLESWLRPAAASAANSPGPFIELEPERVRIGQTWLPRLPLPWHSFVPDAQAFAHFCIDKPTAETLAHVAQSVALREPCLLEGETSTSKTSSILYLASLLGQPVVRINLNGQTDTGELVGRYVPQNLGADLPLDIRDMSAGEELLQPETRMIMSRAESECRRLTALEVQQIMANEGMHAHPWRWQDGLVVQAMKKGWWVLLDEVNLAEPQILERMNSVLEQDPHLVLTEHDNSVVGWGGTPVHPGFRIFATMNPAEYAGRSVMSPAYRDRWRAYRLVPKAREVEYAAMLRRLVFGEQPRLMLRGMQYEPGAVADAPFARVAKIPRAAELLAALASFHAGLEQASSAGAQGGSRIGSRRKERQVFTRRGLLSVVAYLAESAGGGVDGTVRLREALMRYYLARVGDDDRAVVLQLLDAVGIGPTTWNVGE